MKCKILPNQAFGLFLLLCLAATAHAQPDWESPPYRDHVDFRVQSLDKSGIASGILYDRSFPVANVNRFKAQQNYSDTSGPRHFVQAYYEMYNAAYTTSRWLAPEQLDQRLDSTDILILFP